MEVPWSLEEVPEVDPQEILVTVQGKNGRSKEKKIYLLGHCAFCLKMPDKCPAGDGDETGRKRPRKQNLKTISMEEQVDLIAVNWTWAALQRRKNGGDHEYDEKLFDVTGGYLDNDKKKFSKFEGMPKLCRECLDKVRRIDKLLKELGREVGELRRVLTKCKEQGSCRHFVRTLHNLGLDSGVVADTMEFVEEFRSRIAGVQDDEIQSTGENDPLVTDDIDDDPDLGVQTSRIEPKVEEEEEAPISPNPTTSSPFTSGSVKPADPDPLAIDDYDGDPDSDFEANDDDDVDHDYSYDNESSTEEDDDDDYIPSGSKRAKFDNKSQASPRQRQNKSIPNPKQKPETHQIPQRFETNYVKEEEDDECLMPDDNNCTVEVGPRNAKDDTPETTRLKIKIPPGASSQVKKDEAGKPLYLTVNRPASDKSRYKKYFICLVDNCGYHFEGKIGLRNLQDHQIKHRENKGKPIQAWSFTKNLVKETRKHKIIFKCELCINGRTRTFRVASELKSHLRKHNVDPGDIRIFHESGSSVNTCELCKIRLPRSELLEHVKGHVGEEYTVRCPDKDCWFVCITQYELWKHLKISGVKCLEKAGIGEDVEEFKRKQRTCTICGFTAKHLLVLRYHLLEEHETPEKNYPCPISGCGAKFTVKQSVVLHLGQHDVQRQVKSQPCLQCDDRKKIKLEEMEAHLKEEHGISEVVKCLRCPFLFASREQLVEHVYQHRFGELLCDICGDTGERFLKYSSLAEHYFTQHQIGKPYNCEFCTKMLWRRESLSAHIKCLHGNGSKSEVTNQTKQTFNCGDCEQAFKTKSGFISHRIKLHGDPPLGCKYCCETFNSKQELGKHEKVVHKGMSKRPDEFPCLEPNCGKVFKMKHQLKYHHKFHHLGEKGNHICEHCAKSFKNSTGLKSHVETVHLGLRSYICEICGDGFKSGNVLKKHGLIHTGERPFKCNICDQRFRHKEVLRRHLISHQEKGADFKPNGPMKKVRARVQLKRKGDSQ